MSSTPAISGKNPRGFPQRLRLLMDGEGWTSRDLSQATGGAVSHATIENWLKDTTQAGVDQVQVVATVFEWTAPELYYGHPGADTMTRVAELESAVRRLRRTLAAGYLSASRALGDTDGEYTDTETARKLTGAEVERARESAARERPTTAPKRPAGQGQRAAGKGKP